MIQSEESMANRSTEFWGIHCEGGKKYSQIVRQKFHMTMAALDPTVVPTSPVVSLMVDRGGCDYLLCSLKPGTLLQVNLNLYFDKGEKVTFSLVGKGKIHLSGYHIYEQNDPVPATNKEKGIKNPQSNASSSQIDKKINLAVKESDSSDVEEISNDKNKGKAAIPKKPLDKKVKQENDESDDDESDEDSSDEDFSDDSDEISQDNKKDSKRLQSYKRSWSTLTNGDDEEDDSDSEDSDEDDEESSKKLQFQNMKRPKNEASGTIVSKESEKRTPEKKSGSDSKLQNKFSKEDLLNSSIGRTPMPKTPKDSILKSSKLVTPKKVEFMDIELSDSDNEKDTLPLKASPSKMTQPTTPNKEAQPATPSTETKKKKKKKKNKASLDASGASNETPSKPKGLAEASYNQKLPGGLEYEDIRVGNGPIAKKGRLVHVYYTGMLENNRVFDSQEAGKKPFSFKLGGNQVIKGWDLGIEGMKVGGKRRMKIPPKLGYASQRAGVIPPNSTLYFTVELKAVS